MKMHMKMNKQQSGFTLIELVMVIVVLGILAATALPKFVNLGTDARAAAMKAVEGSMRSTNAIIYAKASVGNQLGAASRTTLVNIDGKDILLDYGFAKNASELVKAMDLTTADFTVAATNGKTVTHNGAIDKTKCLVTYGVATSTSLPTYALEPSGC